MAATAQASAFGQPQAMAFQGAPASKLLAALTALSYFVIHSQNAHNLLSFDSLRMRNQSSNNSHRYWTSKLTFGTAGELVMGGLLLTFLARKMEREMGSRKFVVFYLLVMALQIAAEVILVQTDLIYPAFRLHYAGPYAQVAALFCLFHTYTPRLHPRFFQAAGLEFSEKSFYYFWFAQVATAVGWSSVGVCVTGWIVCQLYIHVSHLQSLDVPNSVATVLSKLGERFLSSPPPMLVPGVAAVPGGGGGGARGGGARRPAAAAAPAHPVFGQAPPPQGTPQQVAAAQRAPPPPDEGAIEQLVMMGFDRPQVIEALQYANNDVNRAADRLLTQLQ